MTSFSARTGRFILWIIVTVLVLLAISVTALRIYLPKLDQYKVEITHWVEKETGLPFEIGEVKGYWRNTRPSISLKNVHINETTDATIFLGAEEVVLELDLVQSLLNLQPQAATLDVKGLKLDISHIDLFAKQQPSSKKSTAQKEKSIERIETLFLRQLTVFNLLESEVTYQTYGGDKRTLSIEQLNWQNQANQHKLDGIVSILGSHINSLVVKADVVDNGSFSDVSGDVYLQANNLRVTPWLTEQWIEQTGIESGNISFNSWFSIQKSRPVDAYVELLPSELVWNEKGEHLLQIEEGIFKLMPSLIDDNWQVSGHSLRVRTDDYDWPSVDLAFQWTPEQWTFNVSQLEVENLRPIAYLIPNGDTFNQWLDKLSPHGLVEDIRFSQRIKDGSIRYSASLSHGGINQWELLPEVHQLKADIAGTESAMSAKVTLIDDILPYGDVFQAPLHVKNGEVDIVWQSDELGWRLWADKVTVATPDLQVQGAFKLDFPNDESPFLSFFAEADLYNAGETWRYLPTRALGQNLTNYLSTAIQGGKAENAQIIWFGPLRSFPYLENNGVFQANVNLKDTKFSFDTRWPAITDMQLDLLFENASMFLDSRAATLMDVTADRISGQIAHLGPSGKVEIKAETKATGQAVHDYMMATPLVNSVGAALTAINVNGEVSSEFQLMIPFNRKVDSRAWGHVDLPDNNVSIETPPIDLEHTKGRVTFDNDVVKASGFSAQLLKQPISFDFKGQSLDTSYSVGIDVLGDWEVEPLSPYIGDTWKEKVQGHAPWTTGIDIQLNDVGFTYQIDTSANLEFVSSSYPIPLAKSIGDKSVFQLQASGNQEDISARLQLPDVRYQAEIDISGEKPVLEATYLLVGKGGFKVSPIVGHDLTIRTSTFDLDQWISLSREKNTSPNVPSITTLNTPEIPFPHKVSISADTLTFASIDWNNVNINGRKKQLSWLFNIDSSEVKGQAYYLEPYDLSVSLDKLHIYVPSLAEEDSDKPIIQAEEESPLISEFDREFHRLMPNLTLNIDDLWLQGYKVGSVAVDLQRNGDRLNWKKIDINSGSNQIKINGWWELSDNGSHSQMKMFVKGDNNTELMDRFGISSGIQKAPFEMTSNLEWQGSPWALRVNTLNGDTKAKFGKGIISDVSGAAKLLGMFSLDSIIRKMQLDFTDVFDNGMAFNSITGDGKIENGVFVTNNIEMDATAGQMIIRGMADLVKRQVDAEVEFTPDLTSGIPVITAFAVAPQTAIVVFAISTVISPVVDVFTKIRYHVIGPLDSPEVKEISRSKGEYTLPDTKEK